MVWYLHCWVQEQQQERRRGWVSLTGCYCPGHPGHSGRSLAPGCSPGGRGPMIHRICSWIVIPWHSVSHHFRFQASFTGVPWMAKFFPNPIPPYPIVSCLSHLCNSCVSSRFSLKTMLLVLVVLCLHSLVFPVSHWKSCFLCCSGSHFPPFPVQIRSRFPFSILPHFAPVFKKSVLFTPFLGTPDAGHRAKEMDFFIFFYTLWLYITPSTQTADGEV